MKIFNAACRKSLVIILIISIIHLYGSITENINQPPIFKIWWRISSFFWANQSIKFLFIDVCISIMIKYLASGKTAYLGMDLNLGKYLIDIKWFLCHPKRWYIWIVDSIKFIVKKKILIYKVFESDKIFILNKKKFTKLVIGLDFVDFSLNIYFFSFGGKQMSYLLRYCSFNLVWFDLCKQILVMCKHIYQISTDSHNNHCIAHPWCKMLWRQILYML